MSLQIFGVDVNGSLNINQSINIRLVEDLCSAGV